jgi:hypothetical protein
MSSGGGLRSVLVATAGADRSAGRDPGTPVHGGTRTTLLVDCGGCRTG